MVWMYVGFISLVCALLLLDLGVFHRKVHVVAMKEALVSTVRNPEGTPAHPDHAV